MRSEELKLSKGRSMRVNRSSRELIREEQDWATRWEGADKGLITCWEAGRELATTQPGAAELAKAGELVVLPWKGGVDKEAKKIPKEKIGSLYYVAMWQGLRGDDLEVDTERGTVLACTASGCVVTYYFDLVGKNLPSDAEEQEAEQ